MEPSHGKNNWIGVIIILVILIGAFFFISRNHRIRVPDAQQPAPSTSISDLPLFKNGLAAANVTADQIGFHSFSPDGKYFFFSAFKRGGSPANQAYIVKLSDGTTSALQGTPERGIDDSRLMQLATTDNKLALYFLDTGEIKTYDVGNNFGYGTLSPDGKLFVVNTQSGIKKIDVASGLVASFTKAQYDGAYAWYPDSNRILGYKETGENLFEAGKGRTFGVWDMSTGDFTPIPTSIADKLIRMVQWVVPGVVARVNTGWDDGSHDYLVNVSSGRTVDLGDTSGSMMGGVAVDPVRGLLAVVGGDDQSVIGSAVLLYRGIDQVHSITLPKGYFRSNAQIVDTDHLIYLRSQQGDRGVTAQALVELDLAAGTETVLRDIPAKDLASLSLSPDHKTWVLSDNDQFITGTL